MVSLSFNCRFIARPCAKGLKIQANGPQKAQPNAILEKVFTAITKVMQVFFILVYVLSCLNDNESYILYINCLFLASTQMRSGWKAYPSSSTGMFGPSNAGSDKDATRRNPALLRGFVKACKANYITHFITHYITYNTTYLTASNLTFM